MNNRDNLHFRWGPLLTYNKVWNFCISERESGKSTDAWLMMWEAFHYNQSPSCVFRRLMADITPTYIDDVENVLNKFLEKPVQLVYIKGDIKSGIVDVRLGEYGVEYSWQKVAQLPIFFRIIGLSNPMNRIKSLMLPNIAFFFFDEFICNLRGGEKYLKDEFFRIQEIYTTYNREAKRPIRILCAGNPYSVYCPLFLGLEVNTSLLKPGAKVVGPDYIISCFQVPTKLKKKILAANPMYQFDDAYRRYAFGGEAINDQNIRIRKMEPRGSKLIGVFKMGNEFISVHRCRKADVDQYWVCKHKKDWIEKVSKRRHIIVFNFGDMCDGSWLMDYTMIQKWSTFKTAMNKQKVSYNCIDAKYMSEDIYALI